MVIQVSEQLNDLIRTLRFDISSGSVPGLHTQEMTWERVSLRTVSGPTVRLWDR